MGTRSSGGPGEGAGARGSARASEAAPTRKRATLTGAPAASHVHPPGAGKRATLADAGAASHVCGSGVAGAGAASHVWGSGAAGACARLAARQKGVVSRAQLLAAGSSRHEIDWLLERGFLHPLHRGVYAVGHPVLPQHGREQAALLSCGARSFLCGPSALHLWGVLGEPPGQVHVSAVGRHCRPRSGIRLHRIAVIDPRDTRTRRGLPVSSPARALIEYAASAPPQGLEEAVAEARVMRLVRSGELEAALQRAGRTRGAAEMRAFLADEGGPEITRSHAERRFRRYLREARLPEPIANQALAGYAVDFLWPEERVVLEIDGFAFHAHRRAFERDRRKDQRLADAGYHVIRVSWNQFTREPLALIAHIARILDRRARLPH